MRVGHGRELEASRGEEAAAREVGADDLRAEVVEQGLAQWSGDAPSEDNSIDR